MFDSKSNHITFNGPNTEMQTFTTGFDPNPSHKGSDSALSMETKLNEGSTRPRRVPKPNSRYSPEDYDLNYVRGTQRNKSRTSP